MLWIGIPALVLPIWMSFGRILLGVGGWGTLFIMMIVLPATMIVQGIALALALVRGSRTRPMAAGPATSWALACYLPCAVIAPLTLGDVGDAPESAALPPLQSWGLPGPVVDGLLVVSWAGVVLGVFALLVCAIVDLRATGRP